MAKVTKMILEYVKFEKHCSMAFYGGYYRQYYSGFQAFLFKWQNLLLNKSYIQTKNVKCIKIEILVASKLLCSLTTVPSVLSPLTFQIY